MYSHKKNQHVKGKNETKKANKRLKTKNYVKPQILGFISATAWL